MKKTIMITFAVLVLSFLGGVSYSLNKTSIPGEVFHYDVELTVTGDEITCGYVAIQISHYDNNSWWPVTGIYEYYVDGTGIFDIDVPGTNSCGSMKITCIYHSNEGGSSCQSAGGNSTAEFTRSCLQNEEVEASIAIYHTGEQ